jgi:WD40 repeat protein
MIGLSITRLLVLSVAAFSIAWPLRPSDAIERAPRATLHLDQGVALALALSVNGETIACGCGKSLLDPFGAIELWDLAKCQRLTTFPHPSAGVAALAFGPDGKTLASGNWDSTVIVRDLPGGTVRLTMKGAIVPSPIHALAVSPDGQSLAGGDWILHLWDARTGKERATFLWTDGVHADQITAVAFSPDGQLLASASWDGTVKLWDVHETNQVSDSDDALARLRKQKQWNPRAATLRATLKGPVAQAWTIAFDPKGETLAVGYEDGAVILWDITRAERKVAWLHRSAIKTVVFAPAGNRVAVGCADGTIRLSDAADGKSIAAWQAHDGEIVSVIIPATGRTVISAAGSEVKLWDLAAAEAAPE